MRLVVLNFAEGNYNLNITYYGDDVYYGSTNNASFSVTDKIISEIKFIEPDLYIVNKTSIINITTNFPSGILNVFVDGKKIINSIRVLENKTQLILNYLSAGYHNIMVTYDGDYDYTNTTSNITVNVVKYDSLLSVDIDPVYVDDIVDITVHVNKTAGGYVTVNVNNKVYHIKIKDSIARLNLTGLDYGTYTVGVNYLGDDYYNTNYTSKDFTINRYESHIIVDDIVIGDDLQINLTGFNGYNPAEITGKLNITMGSVTLNNLMVVDGKVIIPMDKLPILPDAYECVLNYSGNYKFLPCDLTTIININKLPAPTINPVLNVTIDDDLNITVTGDERFAVDGNVSVKINNGESFILHVVNGVFTVCADKLPQYESLNNIEVSYANGTYYEDTRAVWSLHSDKITDYIFTISNATVRFGENATLDIILPDDVTATLTVKINDVYKTVEIINGYGKLENISGLHAGLNTVSSMFGSDKYETSTANSTVQVESNDMTLTIIVPDVQLYVDESAIVSVYANVSLNDNVTLFVNGKAVSVKLTNGEGSFTINHLVYGDYVFTAIFKGNENYTYTTASEKVFSVDKNNVTMNVTTSDVVVGHDVIVKVNIDDDATGLVIVKINGVEYSLNVSNDEFSVVVPDLGNGTYNIVAKYYGDGKYYGFENNTIVNVLKLTPSIAVSSDILIGEDFIISITNSTSLVGNPGGKLIFTIGADSVEVDVINGVAIIKASDLPQEDNIYTATVEYGGDNNYYSLIETVCFTIDKVPSLLITVPSNVTIDDELVILVGDNSTDGKLNVTVGNGELFTVDVVNGTAIIPVKYLPQKSNLYAIQLVYYDGSYWNDTGVVRSFHADKITDYPFIISNDTIKFDGIATLSFTLPVDVNTTLTVLIDDIVKTVIITNGKGFLSIANLHAGVNLVSTSFGSDKYETSSASSFIRVIANEITLNITVPEQQLYVDQSATVSIQANVSMNNSVIVYVNGEARTLNLTNGKGHFTIDSLVYGKYVFTAVFEGNENYTRANADMKSFNVDKNTPTIIVGVDDILVDEDAVITISNLPQDVYGMVLISINGTVYSINVFEGEGNLTVSGLRYGRYDVVVNFTGDNKYYSIINSTSFNVDKNIIGEIKVSSEIVKDNKTHVTVTVGKTDATGEVIITTPNGEYTGKLLDGKTVIEVGDLTDDETPFNITYVGDAKYLSNTTNGVIVKKGIFIESWVTVNALDIMVDDETLISVNVPDDATGFVKITVNGMTVQLPLVDATATFSIGDLPAGTHTITVEYLGDNKYYNSTNTSSFTVMKYSTGISVSAVDGIAGNPTAITVKANVSDASGKVILTVNGINYTGDMKNGVVVLNVSVDNAGDNIITALYEGNSYYNSSSAIGSVKMNYTDATVSVSADNINVGDDAIIIVSLPDDASGNVTLSLNGNNDYLPAIIDEGVAKFTVSNLSAGTYTVIVNYMGNSKYDPQFNETVFIVSKLEVSPSMGNKTSVEVTPNDNGSTTINVTVPDDATGNVTVNIDGKNYTVPIINGTASVVVDNLNNNSNVSVSYAGDDKYAGFNETTKVSSEGTVQFTPTLTISTEDISVGDIAKITVNLPADATGTITLTVNGQTYVESINNANAVFNVSGLGNGTHSIVAVYNGDEKYLKSSNTSGITVSKIETAIYVNVSDINVGDTLSIAVGVGVDDAGGSVTISVDGKNYTSSVSNGQAVFSINTLKEGTYNIKATYNGDDKYLPSTNDDASFTVSKNSISPVGDNKTSVEVTPNEDGTVTVTVNVADDATGNVTVSMDGKNYTVPVVNGTATVVVDDYTNPSNVSVSYSGDDKYDGFTQTGVLNEDGIRLHIELIVKSDKDAYIAGETAVITVTLPQDSQGNVTVLVNNREVKNIMLSGGKLVFDYVVPYEGTFSVEAIFDGDKKYAMARNSTEFSATKSDSSISINVKNTPYNEKPVIEVILPDDASGNVCINVDGVNYTEDVINGKAVFTLPLLDRGTYSVSAVYNGDDKYNANSTQGEFDVVNKVADMDIKVDSIVYGQTANVTVTALDDVTGYVTVSCGENTYFAFIENGTAKLSVPNLEPGLNNITIHYSGDEEYQEKTITDVIAVARMSSDCEIFVEDISQGDVLNVTVRVTDDATGNVVITIGGKNYTGNVTDGVVLISVSGLGAGNYTIHALYLGDKYYNESVDTSSFLVKANKTVFAYEITRGYNSGMDYSVYLTDDLGNPLVNQDVIISVGGVDYIVRSDSNGIATLNVGLLVGDHTVSVVNPVTGEETHSNITIAPRLMENKNIVTYYNSGYSYKVRVIGDDGNPVGAGVKFTISINGKKYTYTTDKKGYLNIKINKRFPASSSKKNRIYKISVSYKGFTVKNTITIKQVLKSKRIVKVKKSARNFVLKATLKQAKKPIKGKVIKFKFKGKTYKAKTNKKGIAKVIIKKKVLSKLKLGKNYKVKITYLTDKIKTYVKVKP